MLNKFTVSVKLYLLIFITAVSLIGLGLYGISDLDKMNRNTQTLYADRVLPFQQLANVRFAYTTQIIPTAQQVKYHQLTFAQAQARLQKAGETINTNWHKYKLTFLTPEEAFLVKQSDAIKVQTDKTTGHLATILANHDLTALDAYIQTYSSADPDPFTVKLSQLMDLQIKIGKQVFDSNTHIYHSSSKKFVVLILLSLAIALSLSFYLIKNIKNLIKDLLTSNSIIKESDEKYQSLFEQASDAIYVVNHEGNFTNVNNSMCQMTGYTRDELLNMNVADLVNDELQEANPLCHTVLRSGETITGERKFVHKAGNIVDIEVNGKKMTDDRVLVIVRDITLRKEMEAELRKAELRFRTLADRSMVGIYIVQKGVFVYVNPRFAEVFGYDPGELIGRQPVEAIIHSKYQAVSKENIRVRVEGEAESVHYEAMGKRKDGSTNWIEFYGSGAIFDEEPTIIGSMIDITERKIAENELRESEQKYKLLFESNPMPLWIVSKDDLHVIAANDAAAKLYGYTREELLNMDIKQLRPVAYWDKLIERYQTFIADATDFGVVEHLKKDGTQILVNIIAQDIMFQGRLVRLSSTSDVTEKLRAEESLKTSEANLQTILNNTDTAYALLNADLDILEYNNRALIFAKNEFNFEPGNNGKLFDLMSEDRRSKFLEYTNEVFKGNTIGYEVVYDQSDEHIWYYVRMFPISNKENEILGMVLAITDVTERKDAEQRLKQAYERTKAHIHLISEMAWKQSHILRSPLANLKGLVTILKTNPNDKEVLSYIEAELERMDTVLIEMAEDSAKDEVNDY
ncbi:MAG: PAS domain S-box protein [Bacteroidota bacterium]